MVGAGWSDNYGIPAGQPVRNRAQRAELFRQHPITLVIPDANAEAMLCDRAIEVAAAGGFALCYASNDLTKYLSIGEECDVFADENDLIEKIGKYLEDPDLRTRIALAGRERVLRDHRLRSRIPSLVAAATAMVPATEARVASKADSSIVSPGQDVASVTSDIEKALSAMNRGNRFDGPARQPAMVVESGGRLLVLLNPGRMSRHFLQDMSRAAAKVGIETLTLEMAQVWDATGGSEHVDANVLARQLQARQIKAVIGSGLNGLFEWPCAVDSTGAVLPFFAQLSIPHLLWWTDHPQWANEQMALRDDLQPGFLSPNCHHFVKSELAAAELREVLGWPHCHGMPVAEDPERLSVVEAGDPEYDLVAIVGSPPTLDDDLVPLIEQDEPELGVILDRISARVKTGLTGVWERHVPGELQNAAHAFGDAWIAAKRRDMGLGSFRLFKSVARDHEDMAAFLMENGHAYFDALKEMWAFGKWQRVFCLRYLARHFSLGLFGHDWSEVGLPGSAWVDHDDMPAVYARGRIAINIAQSGDEEGLSHKPFQIVAAGVPLVHNHVKGLSDCFAPDAEFVAFSSPVEARRKIAALLENPRRRDLMARAARDRLCREHTWSQRIEQLLAKAGVTIGRTSNASVEMLQIAVDTSRDGNAGRGLATASR